MQNLTQISLQKINLKQQTSLTNSLSLIFRKIERFQSQQAKSGPQIFRRMSKDVSRIRQAGDIIKKSNHLQSGPRGAANEREKGGCDSGRRYPNSVTTLLRRRVSRRERGGVRIRDRAIHPLRFLITRRVYVKALRKTTHLALRSLAQCYAMNVSPVKKKKLG